MGKPVFAISLSFETTAKDYDKAYELAERIGAYVTQERMAADFSVIDVELLDDGEGEEDLDFEEDE